MKIQVVHNHKLEMTSSKAEDALNIHASCIFFALPFSNLEIL